MQVDDHLFSIRGWMALTALAWVCILIHILSPRDSPLAYASLCGSQFLLGMAFMVILHRLRRHRYGTHHPL